MASADDDRWISAFDPALYEGFVPARPERVRAVLVRDTTGGAAGWSGSTRSWSGYGRDGDAIAAVLPAD